MVSYFGPLVCSLLLLVFLLVSPGKAQNGLPSINNLKATKIEDSTKVEINYSLVDENSP